MYASRVNDGANTSKDENNRTLIISCIVALIVLFSFTTIVQSLVDRVSINKIVGGFLAFLSGILFIIKPEAKSFLRLSYFIVNALFSIIITTSRSTELNDFIFLFATLLMLMTISDERNIPLFKRTLDKFSRVINFVVIIECFILIYLLVSRTGYSYHWGEGRYFQGLCNSQHTMASLCCLIISFLLFLAQKSKHYVFYGLIALVPSYAIFETGARVFLVPLMIQLILFVQYGFKKRLVRIFIYIVGGALAIFLIVNSTMMDKLSFVLNNTYANNTTSAFTSGRSEFWKADIALYSSGNPIQLLFGRTFEDVYVTNLQKVNLEIWAHNDLIHLLVGTGLLGALLYCAVVYTSLKKVKENVDDKRINFLLVMYIVLPMLLNGFFTYQHFLYSFVLVYYNVLSKKVGDCN